MTVKDQLGRSQSLDARTVTTVALRNYLVLSRIDVQEEKL